MAAWKLWGPGCECCTGCTGTICFTLKECNTTTPIAGAVITISLLGVEVGTGTTDASGQCCIGITSAATYDYTVVKSGYQTKTGTVAATCTTNNVTLTYGASICVTVAGCDGPVFNATITVKSGGTTIGTATTNSSGQGCVQLTATTGSYSVEVSRSRYTTDTSTRTITCGTTLFVTLAMLPGYACCGYCGPLLTTLSATVYGVSLSLYYGFPNWYGCFEKSVAGFSYNDTDGWHLATITCPFYVTFNCGSDGLGNLEVTWPTRDDGNFPSLTYYPTGFIYGCAPGYDFVFESFNCDDFFFTASEMEIGSTHGPALDCDQTGERFTGIQMSAR